jgi:hypothetical protein
MHMWWTPEGVSTFENRAKKELIGMFLHPSDESSARVAKALDHAPRVQEAEQSGLRLWLATRLV